LIYKETSKTIICCVFTPQPGPAFLTACHILFAIKDQYDDFFSVFAQLMAYLAASTHG
jgi:hypothetical protein